MSARKFRGFLGRSMEALQDNAQQAGPAAAASYTLVGAIVLLGGLGYALDLWQGWAPWGLVVGLSLGVLVGFYQLIKTTQSRR
jgi:F0F1-type ATP synthase assembly protein I